jgi:hypothetical protein
LAFCLVGAELKPKVWSAETVAKRIPLVARLWRSLRLASLVAVVKAKRRSEERPIEATTVMLTAHRRLALPLWVNGLAVIPHSRSSVTGTSARRVWYDVAGLLRRKELAIEIVEAEIRPAQQSFRSAPLLGPSRQQARHPPLVPRLTLAADTGRAQCVLWPDGHLLASHTALQRE